MKKEKSGKVTATIPASVKRELDKRAENGASKSKLVALALKAYFANDLQKAS